MKSRTRDSVLGAVIALLTVALAGPAPAEARCRKKEDAAVTPYRQLTWDDFKGAWSEQAGPAGAYIASGMNLFDAEHLAEETADGWVARIGEICLFAQMDKYQSAVRPGSKVDRGLIHEQGHFDITEVHTRRLYKELMDLEVRGADERQARHALRTAVDAIYNKAVKEWQTMEQTYDGETNHGTRKGPQKSWLKTIADMLDGLPAAGRGRQTRGGEAAS